MDSNFKDLIFYTTTDLLYDIIKTSPYTTIKPLCKNINDNITNNIPLTTDQTKVVKKIQVELHYLYGLNEDTLNQYLYDYFTGNHYEFYIEIINLVRSMVPNAYIIKPKFKIKY